MHTRERLVPQAHDANLAACIAAADTCQATLREFARSGARAGPGTPAQREMWRLMLDCAELCAATAAFARTGSVFLPQLAESCCDLCDHCAQACELAGPSAAIDACADACRACAKASFALRVPPAGARATARRVVNA